MCHQMDAMTCRQDNLFPSCESSSTDLKAECVWQELLAAELASVGSIVVPGTLVHEHPAHKTSNVKATM